MGLISIFVFAELPEIECILNELLEDIEDRAILQMLISKMQNMMVLQSSFRDLLRSKPYGKSEIIFDLLLNTFFLISFLSNFGISFVILISIIWYYIKGVDKFDWSLSIYSRNMRLEIIYTKNLRE